HPRAASPIDDKNAVRGAMKHYDETLLSKPTHKVRVEKNVRIPIRDGVTLAADIYRPDEDGKFPVLLLRTFYGRAASAATSDAMYEPNYYAQRGYVLIQQDSRGRYDSDGEYDLFACEPNDGFDTAEWVAKQPWSNGRIGGIGQSGFGLTQLLMAITSPPA